MSTRIALLRGINVGGKRKILMNDLRILFETLGYQNVHTYIQSGNVVFKSFDKSDKNVIASMIENAINDKFGFDVPVIVIDKEQLDEAITINPFTSVYEKEKLHLTFLKKIPDPDLVKEVSEIDFDNDKLIIIKKWAFIYCEGPYHKTRITNNIFENKLKVQATTRTWKTILKINKICQELTS